MPAKEDKKALTKGETVDNSVAMSTRFGIVFMTCLGMCIIHAMRVNIAVTVVTILDKEPHNKVGTLEAMINLPTVQWKPKAIGILHSIFYVGYLITQIPGGYLSTKVPTNRLFGGCILFSCSLNLLLPLTIAKQSFYGTMVVRFVQGLFEGVAYPSCYGILRHWSMPQERSFMGAVVLTGVYSGAVVGLPLSGLVTHYLGWHYVYFIHGNIALLIHPTDDVIAGAFGILWFGVWLFMAYERPDLHPHITFEEQKRIREAQGLTALIVEGDSVPWRSIFASIHVWALNICNFARSFVFFLLLTNEPAYLNTFNFSLAENGVYSSLPHVLMALIAALSGPLADYLRKDALLTTTQVRRIFTGIGFGFEAVCLVILATTYDSFAAILFLTLGVGISGITISGWQINHLDLAPRYASVLVGISTACGTLAGILVPLIVGALTSHQTVQEWHNVFFTTSAILAFAVLFYSFFSSGEPQPWAEPKVPEVKLVHKPDPVAEKPYRTFLTQSSFDDGQNSAEAKSD